MHLELWSKHAHKNPYPLSCHSGLWPLYDGLGTSPTAEAHASFPQTVIEDDCLPMDQFAVHLMPHLLTLANDRVPNVRVLLAKTLRQTLLEKGGWR